jgi:hypothetical protein
VALTDAFLGSCRSAVAVLTELTTFRTANRLGESEHTISGRATAYQRTFGTSQSNPSPAYNLALAIRQTVSALADAAGTLGVYDRERAVRTLTAEYVPATDRPPTAEQEATELAQLLAED